jgi:hypothetical protein
MREFLVDQMRELLIGHETALRLCLLDALLVRPLLLHHRHLLAHQILLPATTIEGHFLTATSINH